MMYDEATLALMPPADRAAAVALMDAQYGGQGLAEYIEQHNPAEPVQPHLEPLVGLLERTRHERVFACLDLPPRHAKTTTIGRGLAWLLGFAPADTHAYVTYNDRQAKSKSRPIRAQALRAGVQLDNATSNLSEWRTTAGGGLLAVGANAGITGQGVSGVFVFDDPYANRRQADSPVYREMIWDLFTEVVFTRLEKASVIIVHCMTGDTRVLMETGNERALRDVRPGDRVATYDNGKVSVANVVNWVSQGLDCVFAITMKSGRVVRANARHPFLVAREGGVEWVRVANLAVGNTILSVTGASGAGSSARCVGATSQPDARGSAQVTTGNSDGQQGITVAAQKKTEGRTSDIGMGSNSPIMKGSSRRRVGSARSVESHPECATPEDGSSYSLIIATPVVPCAVFSATDATSPSATAAPLSDLKPPPNTYVVGLDEVVSIAPDGRDEVFDIQVEGTENFIANGLVSHNTRWHDDDLIGRIKKRHAAGELPALFPWEFVSMSALAQENDILGRAPGEALWPTRFAVPELHAIRETIGEWSFGALYQGNPQPKGSKLFSEPHLYDPAKVDFTGFRIYIGVDPAATAHTRADWSVAVAIAIRGQGTQQVGFVLDVLREQNDIPTFVKRLRAFQARWYFAPAFIEAVAGFKAVPQSLLALDKSLKVQETKVGGDKFVRAQPLSGAWNVGRVLLPTRVIMADGRFSDAPPQWLKEYVKEFAEFTGVGDAQDDQVDATAHAWNAVAMPAPPPTRESQLDQRFRPRGR